MTAPGQAAGPAARGRPRSEKARKAILEAAAELLVGRGLGAVSMDAVAERAGVSKATIYRWWPTKETLALDALYTRWAAAAPVPRDTGSLRGDLVELLQPWVELVRTGPYAPVIAALLTEARTDPVFGAEYRRHVVQPRRDQAREILDRAVTRGEVADDLDFEVALDLIYGPLYHRLLQGHAPLDDAFVRTVVDFVLAGIAHGGELGGGSPRNSLAVSLYLSHRYGLPMACVGGPAGPPGRRYGCAVADIKGIYEIVPGDGRVLVKTGREGLAARAGHDLTIEITRWRARITVPGPEAGGPAAAALTAELDLSSLEVREGTGGAKPLSDKDRKDIQATARKVLGDPVRAVFTSTQVIPADSAATRGVIDGTLDLHGTVRPVRLQVTSPAPGQFRGAATIRQTEFGITPYSGFLGALKLKDEIVIEFEVSLYDMPNRSM